MHLSLTPRAKQDEINRQCNHRFSTKDGTNSSVSQLTISLQVSQGFRICA
jgi:hypothetical protein